MPKYTKWTIVSVIVITLVIWNRISTGESSDRSEKRTILAVFAHPDDEFMVSPILSKFARRGDEVYLAVATDGRFGVTEHAGIPAGDSLATVRTEEIQCSAKALGINPPKLFGLKDGFAHKQPELGNVLADFGRIHNEVSKLISELKPDALITWGPGGGYGHPDHRAISNIVTEVFQLGGPNWPATLLYTGMPSERFESLPEFSRPVMQFFITQWNPTLSEFLPVQISYDETDLNNARKSLGCHQSQFTTADMDELIKLLDHVYNGKVTLRPWNGNADAAMNLLQ